MTDKAISALTAASSAVGADELVLNQSVGGGAFVTKRIAVSAFVANVSNAMTITKSVPGAFTGLTVKNSNAGTGAYTLIGMGNNVGDLRGLLCVTSGSYPGAADLFQVYSDGAGGLDLGTSSNAPIRFTQSGGEAGRIDTNKHLLLGYISSQGAYKLQVNGRSYFSDSAEFGGSVNAPGFRTSSGSTANVSGFRNLLSLTGGMWAVAAAFGTSQAGWCLIGMDPYGGDGKILLQDKVNSGITFQLSGATLQANVATGGSALISWYATKIQG